MSLLRFAEPHIYTPTDDSLVLWISGAGRGIGSKVFDLSGKGNHGTIYGAVWKNTQLGHGELKFDGVDDYVEILDSKSLDLITLSIVVWGKTTQADTGYFRFITRKNSSGWSDVPYQLGFHASTGNPALIIGNGTDYNECRGVSDIRDGKWHFIVGTVDGSNLKIYVDGILEKAVTQTVTPFDYDGSAMLGKAGVRYFEGSIGLACLYKKALSAREIRELYNKTKYLYGY